MEANGQTTRRPTTSRLRPAARLVAGCAAFVGCAAVTACDAETGGALTERAGHEAAHLVQQRTRVFDGRDDADRVGQPADDDVHFVETCVDDRNALTCSLWRCNTTDGRSAPCSSLGSYDDEGLDPAAVTLDPGRPSTVPVLLFVWGDAGQASGDDECDGGKTIYQDCAADPETWTLACTMTQCGITSYYVCFGDLDGCVEYGDQSTD